ncbi:MAG: DUF4384 domain-containing protein [candidate division Zixibacteria bacterium]|nr:DUF4384 domain-containing protein [candidate division Zixibacteria bacterium]
MINFVKKILILALIAGFAGVAIAGEKHGVSRVEGLEVDIWINKGEASTYYYGEDVAIFFRTNADCYVVVYDIDPAGNVSLIYPSSYDGATYVEGETVYRIPDHFDEYRLEVSGPDGAEYIYAVASYDPIPAPDFIRYEYFDYGEWDQYYDDFIHSVRGERAAFAMDLNSRIARGPHVSAMTMFYIDSNYRHHRYYRHWVHDPYYIGSVWIGSDYPGCEVWIDGVYYGIAPIYVPEIYIGRHWVWLYWNGYPCWQQYFHVRHGHRHHIDAKIGGRYRDFHYGRGKLRSWRFKQDRHRNETDFRDRAERVRQKHTWTRPAPPSRVIGKYSRNATIPVDNSSRADRKIRQADRGAHKASIRDSKKTGNLERVKDSKDRLKQTDVRTSDKVKKSLNLMRNKTILKDKDEKNKVGVSKKKKSQSKSSSRSSGKKTSSGSIDKGSSNSKPGKASTSKGTSQRKRGRR